MSHERTRGSMSHETFDGVSRRDTSSENPGPSEHAADAQYQAPRITVLGTIADVTRGSDPNLDTDAGFAGSNFP